MYRRQTTRLRFAALAPHLASALADHARARQLTLDAELPCWLTHSENPRAEGLLGSLLGRRANPVDPDAAHDGVLVIHATQLLVGTTGEKRGTVVLSLPLALASVVRGSGVSAKLAAAVPGADDGITISGFPGEHGRTGTYFFGLEAGAELEACASAVASAIAAAKRG